MPEEIDDIFPSDDPALDEIRRQVHLRLTTELRSGFIAKGLTEAQADSLMAEVRRIWDQHGQHWGEE